MKAFSVVAMVLFLFGNGVFVQAQDDADQAKQRRKLAQKIMELVDKRLKENDEKILAEVREILAREMGKGSGEDRPGKGKEEKPAQKKRGYLGISIDEVDEDTRSELGLEEGVGVRIAVVQPESAAEKAGLEVDDVVIAIDGKSIGSLDELKSVVTGKKEGEPVELTIVRGKEKKTVKAKLGPWPDEEE